jgi:hypothetical protein
MDDINLSSTERFLSYVRQSTESAMAHFIHYRGVQQSLRNQDNGSRGPLFDVMVACHSLDDSMGLQAFLGAPVDFLPVRPKGRSKFPLMIELTEMRNGSTSLVIEYRTSIFTDEYAHSLQLAVCEILSNLQEKGPVEILSSIRSQFRSHIKQNGNVSLLPNGTNGDEQSRRTDIIRDAFADALLLRSEQVGDDDSFFQLGGSSIDLTQVQYFLSQRGCFISLQDLMLLGSPKKIGSAVKH